MRADDITTSKPEPDGYLLAVKCLNKEYPELNLQPQECLAIEDTPAGIAAAKPFADASCWCSEYLPIPHASALL